MTIIHSQMTPSAVREVTIEFKVTLLDEMLSIAS